MTARLQTRHLALLACGYVVSTLVAFDVFGPIATWDTQGLVGRLMTIYLLPIAATYIYLLLLSQQRRHAPANGDPLGDDALQGIVFWILFFLIGVHLLMMAVLTRVEPVMPWAQRAVVVFLGISLVAIGNLLPRTRPNFALGIRTERTLTDRQLWIITHRMSGYTICAIGLLSIVAGLVMHGTTVAAAPFIGLVAGAAFVTAYYWRVSAT
jgi:hypothetical protein